MQVKANEIFNMSFGVTDEHEGEYPEITSFTALRELNLEQEFMVYLEQRHDTTKSIEHFAEWLRENDIAKQCVIKTYDMGHYSIGDQFEGVHDVKDQWEENAPDLFTFTLGRIDRIVNGRLEPVNGNLVMAGPIVEYRNQSFEIRAFVELHENDGKRISGKLVVTTDMHKMRQVSLTINDGLQYAVEVDCKRAEGIDLFKTFKINIFGVTRAMNIYGQER